MKKFTFLYPYTGLQGTISNSMQVFLPAGDRRAKIFWPDIMLSHGDYEKYGFDRHAEILFLMDSLNIDL